MSETPNQAATSDDFEFSALAEARNYRWALMNEFGGALRGEVLEVGAGIGQMTEQLVRLPQVRRALAIEPDPDFCAQHRAQFPTHELLQGTAADLPPHTACDGILSVNVLEHIRDDREELARYAKLLQPRHGALCLFVPARPEIYAAIDKDFGHFRRYTRDELKDKLSRAGLIAERLVYFNSVGYLAWWWNFCLLKKRTFEVNEVRAYDRWVFPVVHWFESRVLRPPFGQSLLAVARPRG